MVGRHAPENGEGMFWMGKPLTNYSKDELIAIVELLCRQERVKFEEDTRRAGVLRRFRAGALADA